MGCDVATQTDAMRRQIGVMFQSGALFGSMSLLENVMLPLQTLTALPPDACAAIARVKLAQVGLAEAAALRPAEISGGMAKRAGIARAPWRWTRRLLFLDEPSAGLDPVTSAGLDALILRLRDNAGRHLRGGDARDGVRHGDRRPLPAAGRRRRAGSAVTRAPWPATTPTRPCVASSGARRP